MSVANFYSLVRDVVDICQLDLRRDVVSSLLGSKCANQLGLYDKITVKDEPGVTSTVQNRPILDILNSKRDNTTLSLINGIDAENLARYMKDVTVLCEWAFRGIRDGTPPPIELGEFEFLLVSLRLTITRDMWYECKEETVLQPPLVSLLFLLFTLQMHLRLWRRRELILCEKPSGGEDIPPVWCTASDFVTGKWFIVLEDTQKGKDQEPICMWYPEKVYKAMNLLMRSRIVGAVDLSTHGGRSVFVEYRNALLDRVAMYAVLLAEGTPDKLTHDKLNWFVLSTTILDKSLIDDAGHKSIARKVRESVDEETRRVIKEQFISNPIDETKALESRDDILARIEKQYGEGESEKLCNELERLRKRYRLLQIDSLGDRSTAQLEESQEEWKADGEEEDKAEMESLQRDIRDLELLVQKVKNTLQEKDDAEKDQRLKLFTDMILNGSSGTAIEHSFSMATDSYLRENMYMVDHLLAWQFPEPSSVRLYDHALHKKCASVFGALCKVAIRGGNKLCLDAQKWIVSHSLTLAEREAYRADFSSDAVFNARDVCASQRHTDDTHLKGFPSDMSLLLSNQDHPYHSDFKAFVVWWFLQQILPKVNLDATVFLWGVEEEFMSLDRCQLEHPVMSRVGDRWLLLNTGSWETERGGVNAVWFQTDVVPCLVKFLEALSERKWRLYDRMEKKFKEVSKTALKDIWDDACSAL